VAVTARGGDTVAMGHQNVPLDQAGPAVRDAMLRAPRTVPAQTTVADAREMLSNPRVRLLLVVDGDRFLGSVTTDDLHDEASGGDWLSAHAHEDAPRVDPDASVAEGVAMLERLGVRRLPVVDSDDRLLGLLCLDRTGTMLCVDAEGSAFGAGTSQGDVPAAS
jgi:CBS-domain-containing membrane protein